MGVRRLVVLGALAAASGCGALIGLLDREPVLGKHRLIDGVFEDQRIDPSTVCGAPQSLVRIEDQPTTNEHLDEAMTDAMEIRARCFATAA